MITVYIPNNFIPERTYAVKMLLHHYLGIEVDIQLRPKQIHYELVWDNKSIVIYDQFFGHTIVGQTYLLADRIPDLAHEAKNTVLEKCVIIYGEDKADAESIKITSHADLFAGAYFMLTRWEESLELYEDQHGRFPAMNALIVKSGFILRPVVDEYAVLLKKWLMQLGYAVPASKDKFKVVPTCDVDMPFFWLRLQQWKVFVAEWLKQKRFSNFRQTRQRISAVKRGQLKDPYDTFDYMMSAAEAKGLRFDFNMLVGGISKFEGYYSIKSPRIHQLMQSFIDRGHRVGLHPSYNAMLDHRLMQEEKMLITKHQKSHVVSSRQHYLRIAIPRTFELLADIGIKEDSTLGYAAEAGFRCGTSKPFPVFDFHRREILPVLEHPLLIMDVTLRNYLKLDPDGAISLCDQIIDQVKKHDGQLNFLWHNSNLSEVEGWVEWQKVFEHLISQ